MPAERPVVLPLSHRISLVHEFRKLAHSRHALAADNIRWRHLGITMLGRMELQQKLYQRPLQLRPPIRIKQKSAAGKFGPSRKIHQFQALTYLHVRFWLEPKLRLLAPCPDFRIVLRALAD